MAKFNLYVVGVGVEGFDTLLPDAKDVLLQASGIIGSPRHLKLLANSSFYSKISCLQEVYPKPLSKIIDMIKSYQACISDGSVVVLSTGDPMNFGIGSLLCHNFSNISLKIFPHISAFSLAASRLQWTLSDCYCYSLLGRELSFLLSQLSPERRFLLLSDGRLRPLSLKNFLKQNGYGASKIVILENMGGLDEKIYDYDEKIDIDNIGNFHTLGLVCKLSDSSLYIPPLAGTESRFWHNDGVMTKPEIRAITISVLRPFSGMFLWDIGAGCGSVAIEILRLFSGSRAVAVEKLSSRIALIEKNASKWGCGSRLTIKQAVAPDLCNSFAKPDAIFIGGGLADPNIIDNLLGYLPVGGICVANAVTIEGEQTILRAFSKNGGHLRRIQIANNDVIGKYDVFRNSMSVTQWSWQKNA